jgi:hypothetical protein
LRSLYISDVSVLVIGDEDLPESYYAKRFLPNLAGSILDATQTEYDHTLVLTTTGIIYRYQILGPNNCSDYPQHTLDLSSYLNGITIKRMAISIAIQGHRVISINTDNGLFLIQVRESDLRLQGILLLSINDFTLYGGNDVVFSRMAGVYSLRTGQVLVGTQVPLEPDDPNSRVEYYETLYDLNLRRVISVWDRTNRINKTVITGEFLDIKGTDYIGRPEPPVLHIHQEGEDLVLTWEEVRSDLVDYYTMFGGPNLPIVNPTAINDTPIYTTIRDGMIFRLSIPKYDLTASYQFCMTASNKDGESDPSNVVTWGTTLDATYYRSLGTVSSAFLDAHYWRVI